MKPKPRLALCPGSSCEPYASARTELLSVPANPSLCCTKAITIKDLMNQSCLPMCNLIACQFVAFVCERMYRLQCPWENRPGQHAAPCCSWLCICVARECGSTVGADGQDTTLLGCLADIGNPDRLQESVDLAVGKAAPL